MTVADAAATMMEKSSALSDAPPIRPPSISGCAMRPAQFLAFMLPPYWMRVASATALPYAPSMALRMTPMVSLACSSVAVLPVPMAQMGS